MIGQSIGKYRITRQIGEGGMGAVFEAVHESIGQRVAVKVLHPAYSARPELVNRFFNEARATNIVRHAGLVKTFDFGQLPDGSAYMTMELLEGESLSSRLQDAGGGLPLPDALRIARQVASALAATHREGIVHRDLKPDNIFLVTDPESAGGERAKLLDFGIAKVRAEVGGGQAGPLAATATGALMGTPRYMSPEQCRGAGGVDDRSDVYSLGVILYQMLAGQTPFVAQAPGDLMVLHMTQAPPLLRQVAPHLPEGVAVLVQRMLVKAPGERPAISEVVVELERLGAERAQIGIAARGVPGLMSTSSSGPSTLGEATGSTQRRTVAGGFRARMVGGGLVLLVGTGAGLWALRADKTPHEEGARTPPQIGPVAPPQLERVSCWVTSQPSGAEVRMASDRSVLGSTPWNTEQLRGGAGLHLLVRHAGYAEQQMMLDPSGDCRQQVQLAALPSAPAQQTIKVPATPSKHPSHKPSVKAVNQKPRNPGPADEEYHPKALQ